MIKKLKIKNWKLKIPVKWGDSILVSKKIFGLSLQSKRGFTLVEMLIAVSLFVIVASFSLGAVVSIFDANRKAQTSKTVVDNLNLSLENMARVIRFGNNYFCGYSTDNTVPIARQNCSSGGSNLSVTFGGKRTIYRLSSNRIQKTENGGTTWSYITSPDTKIELLRFYVYGATVFPNTQQPYVVAVIKGYVGEKPTIQSSFSIQTTISQRKLDL